MTHTVIASLFAIALAMTGAATVHAATPPTSASPLKLSPEITAALEFGKRGDWKAAADHLRPIAQRGDVMAQHALCLVENSDPKSPLGPVDAVTWCRRAAEAGYAPAQAALGDFYLQGRGVAADQAMAVSWWRKAAEQGDARAAMNVSMAYNAGQGVPKDPAQAIAWLRRCADNGAIQCQVSLGNAYAMGVGVTKDYASAAAMMTKAADQGDPFAETALAWFYSTGNGVPVDGKRAVDLLMRASEQKYVNARLQLAEIYDKGAAGVTKDPTQAAVWMQRAADMGDARAEAYLAARYYTGLGVPKDNAEVLLWNRKAADQDYAMAQFNLGVMYENGVGVPKDEVEAFVWIYLACAHAPADNATVRTQALASRDLLAQKLTRDQLDTAMRRAQAWTPKPNAAPGVATVTPQNPAVPTPAAAPVVLPEHDDLPGVSHPQR